MYRQLECGKHGMAHNEKSLMITHLRWSLPVRYGHVAAKLGSTTNVYEPDEIKAIHDHV